MLPRQRGGHCKKRGISARAASWLRALVRVMEQQVKKRPMTPWVLCAAVAAAATASACTTLGTGSGDFFDASKGRQPVHFSWKATATGASGEMDATFADGRRFRGTFVQKASERFVEPDRLRLGWRYVRRDWNWDAVDPAPDFETVYGAEVVADLKGAGADRMRCRLTLNDAAAGLAGGAQGRCALAGSGTIDAVFSRN